MDNLQAVCERWRRLMTEHLGAESGLEPVVIDGRLRLAGAVIVDHEPFTELFAEEKNWQDTVIPTMFPNSPRGEPRERLFSLAMREGVGASTDRPESQLIDALEREGLSDPDERAVRATLDLYYRVQRRTKSATRFLGPVPGIIPATFGDNKYRMFTGLILFFMLQETRSADARQADRHLAQQLFTLLSPPTGFLLDQTMQQLIVDTVGTIVEPNVDAFLTANKGVYVSLLKEYGFASSSAAELWDAQGLERYQNDLRTVLATGIPALEKIKTLMFVTYLHLGLRFYRAAFGLGHGAAAFFQWFGTGDPVPDTLRTADGVLGGFRGGVRFRWQTPQKRTIHRGDGSALAFRGLHQEALGYLPYHLLTLKLASRVVRALGGPPVTSFAGLAAWLQEDPTSRAQSFDQICRALRLLYHVNHQWGGKLEAFDDMPGLFHLREAIRSNTDIARHWRTLLTYILPAASDGLSANQGSVSFFQLGPYALFWIAKCLCKGHSVTLNHFVDQMAEVYGLAPQDRHEQELMVGGLAKMNLFTRYADAGESHYVTHIL